MKAAALISADSSADDYHVFYLSLVFAVAREVRAIGHYSCSGCASRLYALTSLLPPPWLNEKEMPS